MMAALMGANMLLNQTLKNKQKMASEQTEKSSVAKEREDGQWVKIKDRNPPIGKLVYTRSPSGLVGAYTLYQDNAGELFWNSWVSDDNEEIVEWFEPYPKQA